VSEHTSEGNRRDRVYEHPSDPADTANRILEPRSPHEPLHDLDEPHPSEHSGEDPHHRLNTEVGAIDETTDSDPYRPETPEDDADRASGVPGSGQGERGR
jgi:hypothetical protein